MSGGVRMMHRLLFLAPALALAACGSDEPRAPAAPTAGQLARVKVDAVTKAYGECVIKAAQTLTLDTAVGPLSQRAVEACPDEREALKREVAAFTRLGRDRATPEQVDALADGAIKPLEGDLREQAAIAILNRPESGQAK